MFSYLQTDEHMLNDREICTDPRALFCPNYNGLILTVSLMRGLKLLCAELKAGFSTLFKILRKRDQEECWVGIFPAVQNKSVVLFQPTSRNVFTKLFCYQIDRYIEVF